MVEAKNQFQMLAEHFAKIDDLEGAIRANDRLSDIDPSDYTSRLKFADMLLETGEADQAMIAYGALGKTLIERDQLDEAERLFRRLLEHELPTGEVMVPICDRLLEAGRVTSAQELLTVGLEASPENIPLRTLQVRTYMALGEMEPAAEIARDILEIDPDNSDVRGLMGNVMISDGAQEEATEMMIPAAEALLEKADYARAQNMLRELAEIAPTDERVLRLAIRAFRPSGDQETLTRLTSSLADVCFTTGQEDQAKRFYLELVAGDPTNELYRERLAQLDGAAGDGIEVIDTEGFDEDLPAEISFSLDGEEAQATGEVSAPPEPLMFDPNERINEAAVFAKYGLNDKAINHLEEVVRRLPDHAEAREALAKLYRAVGQSDNAARTIEPMVEKLRNEGDTAAATAFEDLYGTSSAAEEDDEIIIVEIDGDEMSDVDLREIASDDVDLSYVGVTEPEPEDSLPDAGSATDALIAEPAVDLTDAGPSVEADAQVVEEELVEISTGGDGPSFNELAQLDLFIDQELFEDAVGILEGLEDNFPGDPDLADRRQQLEGRVAAAKPPPVAEPSKPVDVVETKAVSQPEVPPPVVEPVRTSDDIFADDGSGDYIDLAKELEEELAEEEAMVEEATGRGKGEAMLDEVFKEFQKGVAEQLSEEDSDTHFNLGIAYKEMGLLNEAITEFKVASHDPEFFVEACSMIGVCATELEQYEEATAWYQKALVAPNLSTDARTALRYELALAFERTGEIQQALGLFEEIQTHDPAYRDVGARLAALTQRRQVN